MGIAKRLSVYCCIVSGLCPPVLDGQIRHDPPSDSLRFSTLQFDRTLQTFQWSGLLGLRHAADPVSINFQQYARSRIIRGEKNAIQDELGSNLNVTTAVSPALSAVALATSTTLTDNQQLGLGNLSRHRLLAGPRYLFGEADLNVLGGYEWAAQEQVQDQGGSYIGRLAVRELPVEEFSLGFLARTERSSLHTRVLRADTVALSLVREFTASTSNRLSVLLTNQQREFYVVADAGVMQDYGISNNVFRRKAYEVGVVDTLDVVSSLSSVHLVGGIVSRTIDRGYRYKSFSNPAGIILDDRIRESRIFGSAGLSTRLADWLASDASISYEEREERRNVIDNPLVSDQTFTRQDLAAKRLAHLARQTSAALALRARVSEKDSLNLSGSASILRYDTPDSLNTDDRDELLLVAGIEGIHRFSRSLSVGVMIDATLSHLVYIHRLQSANNNWNRILRFKTRVDVVPDETFRTSVTAEVVANYTVYDFEQQVLSVRSFSFRQASWSDSTLWRIGKRLTVTMLGTIRVYERGSLRWREFKERPETYFVEQSYWPRVAAEIGQRLTLSLGYRFFSQARFRYEGRKKKHERTIENSGPTVSLSWNGPRGGFLALEGWREGQHVDGVRQRVFSNMSMIVGMPI